MTYAEQATGREAALQDELTAVRGARWIATASVVVGALNYLYALLLTRLLDVSAYATFAAGQSLILCTAAVAVVTVPWMLAQSLARAASEEERGDAVRFAVLTGAAGGLLAAAAVAAVAMQFAGPATTLVLATTTLLIYVTRVTVGWLQGTERLRTLAAVTTSEAALKLVAGLLLVAALGMSDTGALAAFGIAVLPFVVCRPRRIRSKERPLFKVSAQRELWRRAVGVATLQGVVAVMAAVDMVLVAVLPTDRAAAASYQASVMVGRIPLFLAGAVAMAFLPALSRRRAGTPLAASAVGMYVIVALPLAAVCATAPGAVLTMVFPTGYGSMSALMVYTALAGLALGGLSLIVTFSQAVSDYGCLRPLALGLVGYVAALLLGWQSGGVTGMAIGAVCGSVVALGLLVHRQVRRVGLALPPKALLLEPLALAGILVAVRPYTVGWLIAAAVTAAWAVWRFFGRGDRLGRTRPPVPDPAPRRPR
ncbi:MULTISPECIES: hypothetical protein [Streptomyces]|uniref:Polysaccharide biosynthesis protein n=1 Tax=Streptomyces solicathayae TaxID=3081768 RepID=A0ABZ0LN56_9ACTN|nr:hypothetical protein [Streptomyces sp. HUAS YS2]WOX20929.1 hypothetical protein R2D22_05805 [Streptomyces sp. HUAS YS2]